MRPSDSWGWSTISQASDRLFQGDVHNSTDVLREGCETRGDWGGGGGGGGEVFVKSAETAVMGFSSQCKMPQK